MMGGGKNSRWEITKGDLRPLSTVLLPGPPICAKKFTWGQLGGTKGLSRRGQDPDEGIFRLLTG